MYMLTPDGVSSVKLSEVQSLEFRDPQVNKVMLAIKLSRLRVCGETKGVLAPK